ncbi:hypothetical protein CDAR_171411 [Caerostris darwini]|uniref:Uncharacterized protein n=1 Tax=Caerostris darwini TaxID=1538125 RepID=A0AAV4WM83_9ARAC|nr:hypothetical protein CDAR_171411 [Caerostris darwini]
MEMLAGAKVQHTNPFLLQCSPINKEEVWPVLPLSLQLNSLLSILVEHFADVLAVRRNAPCTAECGNFYVYFAAPPTRKKFGLSSSSHSNLMVFYRSWWNTSPLCLLCGGRRHAQRNVDIFTFIVIDADPFKREGGGLEEARKAPHLLLAIADGMLAGVVPA